VHAAARRCRPRCRRGAGATCWPGSSSRPSSRAATTTTRPGSSGPTARRRSSASSASRSRCCTPTRSKADPLAFLIVKSMLLTGFDAPIEGVMYLDRPIREAELLQAIARVNRTGHGKQFGIVVDYYGVAHHLKEALNVYADEDIDGALQSLKDEIPVLRDRHLRVVDLFRSAASTAWPTPKPASRRWPTSGCAPSSRSSSRPSWRRWTWCCRGPRAALRARRQEAGLHLRPRPQPLPRHAGAGQGRGRQGAQADRRPSATTVPASIPRPRPSWTRCSGSRSEMRRGRPRPAPGSASWSSSWLITSARRSRWSASGSGPMHGRGCGAGSSRPWTTPTCCPSGGWTRWRTS
jgi:hypothetical protein